MQRLLLLLVLAGTARADVTFTNTSFEDALQQATKEHKSVMVDFYTDWCYWCKVIDKQTYTAVDVAAYANDHFVNLKVNAEVGSGIELARKSKVNGYPTIVFFDNEGTETFRVVGFEPPPKFLRSLHVAGMGSTAMLERSVGDRGSDVHATFALAERYAATGKLEQAREQYTQVVRLDTNNALHLAEQAALMLARSDAEKGNVTGLEGYLITYPSAESGRDVHGMLSEYFLTHDNGDKAVFHFEAMIAGQQEDPRLYNQFAWQCAEKGIALDKALLYADKAIALATEPAYQASYLDTKASVLFQLKNVADAVSTEQRALSLLPTGAGSDKLRYNMEKQLKRFSDHAKKK
jgi:thioredoxin-related protein/Tfp pilus assembly protein PilF